MKNSKVYEFKGPHIRQKLRKDGVVETRFYSPISYFKYELKLNSNQEGRGTYYNKLQERLVTDVAPYDGWIQIIADRELSTRD